jgi:hypothetical protein
MTIYTVHIYRELCLVFGDIEADSHEEAVSIARDKPTGDADDVGECDGETFYACVDVQGDAGYKESRRVLFDEDRLRTAAPRMLEALTLARHALNMAPRFRVGDTDSYKIAAAVDRAIAEATAGRDGGRAC